jgi:hypothetical protein
MSPKLSPVANEYARIWADFECNTKDHVLTVQQDDGLNRRMRIGTPGTGIYSWTVVTWPGYLQTVGDIADGFGFRRLDDMISFFDGGLGWTHSDGAPSIDFHYWAEKLTGGRSRDVLVYSAAAFLRHVTEHLEEHEDVGLEAEKHHNRIVAVAKAICERHEIDYDDYLTELRAHGIAGVLKRFPVLESNDEEEDEFFGEPIPHDSPLARRTDLIASAGLYSDTQHEAYRWLELNTHVMGEDIYEIGMRDYDVHFIIACYAIALTVKLWREYEALESTKRERSLQDFIWVEGGLVQNSPSLSVFDLDLIDTDAPDEEAAREALDLYERISAHPRAAVAMARALTDAAEFVRAHGSTADIASIDELEAKRLRTSPAAA